MKRKHLIQSAEYWYNSAKVEGTSKAEAVIAMEQAYNHVENALSYILDKSPEAKRIFDEVNAKIAAEKRKTHDGQR